MDAEQRAIRRITRARAALAVALLGAAAWIGWLSTSFYGNSSPPRGGDSAAASGGLADSTSTSRTRAGRSRDSTAVASEPGPLDPSRNLRDSSVDAVVRSIELRDLAIPVAGVEPDQLVDSYTQARSEGRTHNAIDIIAPLGSPVVAVTDGTIVRLFESVRGGHTLYEIDDDGRTMYYYAHLDRYADGIESGLRVRKGETIAYVGDTGDATPGNYHLHFEITVVDSARHFWSGVPVNPYPILRRK